MVIAVACDHGALRLKKAVLEYLDSKKIAYKDFGTCTADSCDYPDFGIAAAEAVAKGDYNFGVLLCSTGIGMSMAANKVKGVRAALVSDEFSAVMTRAHNDANVLCMGEKVVDAELAVSILDKFLNTGFDGGRHAVRIGKIAAYENKVK